MSSTVAGLMTIILFTCVCKVLTQRAENSESLEMQNITVILEYLSNHYDRHTAPVNLSKPLQLSMELIVESFDNIEEASMEFSLYIYLIQKWVDPRLKNVVNVTTVLTGKDIDLIWTPDTYCLNARQSDLMLPDEQSHSMIRLDQTGRVTYSRGSYLKTSCLMDLRDFPMDDQRCLVHFASYGYSTKYVVYKWSKNQVTVPLPKQEMAQFVLIDSMLSTYNSSFYSGNFTVLTATFEFKRRLGYYLIQIYIPCSFLVMLSWIAFWMDKRDTGNRLTVGVTTILTIMFLLGYSNSSVPKMSYVKAMDIYLLSSFALIFFSLIETVLCWKIDGDFAETETNEESSKYSLDHIFPMASEGSRQRANSKRSVGDSCGPKPTSNSEIDEILLQKIGKCLDRLQSVNGPSTKECKASKAPKLVKERRLHLDAAARVIFPLAYIIFNIIYWSVCG